uniref:Glycoprotein B n=1 Tax=Pongo pygmaeus cytomegalovirus 1 TaxID=203138 RepID=F0J885_9BETA|nr:glycoprotein B [Pongo pygmaeus cytomegalovirus 1]
MWIKIWCLAACASLWKSHAVGATTSSTSSVVTPSLPSDSSPTSSPETEVTTTNATRYILNTTLTDDDVIGVNVTKYPYRVCSMAQGTDVIRFDRNIQCASISSSKEDFDEGMMVVYKRNIVAHTFKVNVYQKVLTFRRSYAYIRSVYLLGSSTEQVPVPIWEVNVINSQNKCYNSYKRVIGGTEYVAYHKDSYVNETMDLVLDDYSNTHSTRYVTVKEVWHEYGSTWLYKETCSLNCMVTVATARSKYPYNFFAVTTGDVVDISPFYNGSNNKYFGENADKFFVRQNYSMVEHYGVSNAPQKVHKLVAFLQRADSVMSWDVEDEANATCQFTFWDGSERVIRSEAEETYHFTSAKMTATFLSKKESVNISNPDLKCVRDEAIKKLEHMFNTSYNETYVKSGNVTVYKTTGGLIVFWQGVKQKSLVDLEKLRHHLNTTLNSTSSHSRKKRSSSGNGTLANGTDSVQNVLYAQLQFTYDTLKNYINRALGQIAEAWCIDQRRTLEVFKELSKINPSAILSAIYNRPIAARFMGDVIGLAKCVNINQTSVKVLRDMRVSSENNRCYSRPVIMFTFVNSSQVQYGQLGEDNEILLGKHRTEECESPSLKIFVAGTSAYEYVDYMYKRMIDLNSISTVDSMIALDIDPLENTDFKVLELYSQDEIRSSNVFDLEEVMREFNSYKQRVRYVEDKVTNPVPPYLQGLDDLMSGLGETGKALGVAIGAVGGAVASIMEGIGSFLKNPFGSFTVLLIVLAVLGVIYLIYMRQKRVYEKPFDNLFPYVVQTKIPNEAPPSYEESIYTSSDSKKVSRPQDTKDAAPAYSLEEAYQMLLALQKLDAEKRREALENAQAEKTFGSDRRPRLLDRIRRRRKGYKQLISEEAEEGDA